MTIAQMREYERQANVLKEAKINKALRNLKRSDDGMFYVGDIADLDNDGWVDKETAIAVIEDLGPEYDSAGFTEEDRIVNGQYMNTEK
jgi:hypothetical protein